jgi:hypothetical protein
MQKRAGRVAQVVQRLPSKCQALIWTWDVTDFEERTDLVSHPMAGFLEETEDRGQV